MLAIAVLIRLPAYGPRSFWIDELITCNVSRLPLMAPGVMRTPNPATHSIVSFCLHDTGPGPLAYLLDGSLSRLAAPAGREFWLRLPGIIAGCLTVLYVLRKGISWRLGRYGTLTAAALLAAHPLFADWSTGARGYAWVVLFAIIEWDMCARLARPALSGRTGAAVSLIVLGLVSLAACLVTPIAGVSALAAYVGLFAFRQRIKLSKAACAPFVLFYGIPLLVAAISLAWTLLWFSTAFATRGTSASRTNDALLGLLRDIATSPTFALFLISGLLAPFVTSRGKVARLWQQAYGWTTSLGMLALTLVLSRNQFLAERYFFPLALPAVVTCGLLVERLAFAIRRGGHGRAAIALGYLVPFALVLLLMPSALGMSATPFHDWLGATEWLKAHAGASDVVICGPNADREVFGAYAAAIGLKLPSPSIIESSDGKQVSVHSTKGLQLAIDSGSRVWFITPHVGRVYPREYWEILSRNFRSATTQRFGREPVQIFEVARTR